MKIPIVTVCPGDRVRLAKIDPDETGGLKKEAAIEKFVELRMQIAELQEILYAEHERSLLLIFQSMDTGGKDGAIKGLSGGLNPAGLEIKAFKSPSQEELDHDFLWRAHRAAPSKGMIGIWNRSHYEDVLIVRVHKLVPKKVWEARYDQINRFEEHLAENGTTIVKFMLHISKDEQKKRLQARLDRPEKWWKINLNDIKERALWDDYQKAYQDAVNCCSTECALWHVVPANHKWARNLFVVEKVWRVLKKMDPRYPKLSFDPKTIRID